MRKNILSDFPNEILYKILQLLDIKALFVILCVSNKLHNLAKYELKKRPKEINVGVLPLGKQELILYLLEKFSCFNKLDGKVYFPFIGSSFLLKLNFLFLSDIPDIKAKNIHLLLHYYRASFEKEVASFNEITFSTVVGDSGYGYDYDSNDKMYKDFFSGDSGRNIFFLAAYENLCKKLEKEDSTVPEAVLLNGKKYESSFKEHISEGLSELNKASGRVARLAVFLDADEKKEKIKKLSNTLVDSIFSDKFKKSSSVFNGSRSDLLKRLKSKLTTLKKRYFKTKSDKQKINVLNAAVSVLKGEITLSAFESIVNNNPNYAQTLFYKSSETEKLINEVKNVLKAELDAWVKFSSH